LESNPQMKLIDDNAKWLDERNKENVYSLQIDKFKQEQKHLEESNKKYKSITDYNNKFQFKSLPYEEEMMKVDVTLKEKRKDWHDNLAKDIYMEEAIHVLDDLNAGDSKKVSSKIKKEKVIKS